MKNKTLLMGERSQSKVLNWLYQEETEDDFLLGKTPKDLSDTWEDEE